jgi:hypothetical protein
MKGISLEKNKRAENPWVDLMVCKLWTWTQLIEMIDKQIDALKT